MQCPQYAKYAKIMSYLLKHYETYQVLVVKSLAI